MKKGSFTILYCTISINLSDLGNHLEKGRYHQLSLVYADYFIY